MKRIALVLSVLATLAFAGPVSANHEIWKGYFAEPGIHGNVSVTTNYNHTQGTLAYKLDGLKDGDATIFIHGGTCAKDLGAGVVLRWVTGRDFPNSTASGRPTYPRPMIATFLSLRFMITPRSRI